MDVPDLLGTLPAWISAGSLAALLTIVLKFLNDRRKVMADAHKTEAEAEKVEAETNGLVMAHMAQEIGRLQERVKAQDDRAKQQDEQIRLLRADIDNRISHEAKLEQENRALRAKVGRMERRIQGLETIFKLHPATPEMQAELDKLELEDLDA